jgi:polysaccharide pyruvyl transferase WcaK-like protein
MGSFSISVGRALSGLRTGAMDNERRVLIIPPAVPGSLGDAAMISASAHFLRTQGAAKVDLLYGKAWNLDEKIDSRISGERFFYKNSYMQQALLVSLLPRYSECYFIGADVIDGAYNPKSVSARISLLAEAASLGKKATLLGASYNKTPEDTTKKALSELPASVTICARDPVSRKRMEEALNRPIRQVADLAFLLRPRLADPIVHQAKNWIASRRKAGDQVIGLNANYLHAQKDPQILGALNILVERLLCSDLSIMLIPHDTRSEMPDKKLLEEATAFVSVKNRERIYMLPPESPGIVRAVVPELDMLATGRMHTAILSISGGTPAFCFAYQDKFEGLLQFFDLERSELLSSPTELSAVPEIVAEKIVAKLKEKKLFEEKIKHHISDVLALSENNFL